MGGNGKRSGDVDGPKAAKTASVAMGIIYTGAKIVWAAKTGDVSDLLS
jgi:hypothetical protein